MKNQKTAVALDGGGIRGIITLKILSKIESNLPNKLHTYIDYFAGTSTGGIEAVLLSTGKYSCDDILKVYTEHGTKIFDKRFLRFGLFRPKYSDRYFNDLLKEYTNGMKMSDVKVPFLCPAVDASKNGGLKIFKSDRFLDNDYSLFDVIRATVSAPAYFKQHIVDGVSYVDGGLFANNPSMILKTEMLKKFGFMPNLLSIGSGFHQTNTKHSDFGWGKIGWATKILPVLLNGSSKMVDHYLDVEYGGSEGTYVRINGNLVYSDSNFDNASPKNIAALIKDADVIVENNTLLIDKFIHTIL